MAEEMETSPEPFASMKRPGLDLPLDSFPEDGGAFPVLHGRPEKDGWKAYTLTVREMCMLKFIEEVTNKPRWFEEVFKPHITQRWKADALNMDWISVHKHGDFTKIMADACIEEIKYKAFLYQQTSLIPVLDYSSCVLKSDSLIPDLLWLKLKDAIKPLEATAASSGNHPRGDETVLHLVDPSLWPLTYGRSRVLPDKRTGLTDALSTCNTGTIVPAHEELDKPGCRQSLQNGGACWEQRAFHTSYTSARFQWLPCDVEVDGQYARITSYVNNLHPTKYADLYAILEEFISAALPAWDVIYRWHKEFYMKRHHTCPRECNQHQDCYASELPKIVDDSDWPGFDQEDKRVNCQEQDVVEKYSYEYWHQFFGRLRKGEVEFDKMEYQHHYPHTRHHSSERNSGPQTQVWAGDEAGVIELHEVVAQRHFPFANHHISEPNFGSQVRIRPEHVSPWRCFPLAPPQSGSRRLQVIAKLTNIHLTPDKPSYEGSSFRVEGLNNEHICATALFYYDDENITDSRLAFRTLSNREDFQHYSAMAQSQESCRMLLRLFALDDVCCLHQSIGSALTKHRRAIFFPNIYQHRVGPFKLADPTRSGHRKILALYLVDPAVPIVSTANVPPQQTSWSLEQTAAILRQRLPQELVDMILEPAASSGSREAEAIRKELNQERSDYEIQIDRVMRTECGCQDREGM